MSIPTFGATRDVSITVLVDNRADLIVKSTESVKYHTDGPLLAEHGYSALIELKGEGRTILWDAGACGATLLENLRRMAIGPGAIDAIALSHGHWDHTGGMVDLLRAMALKPESRDWPADASMEELQRYAEGRRIALVAHPAAFRERWKVAKEGRKTGPALPPPRAEWEALGAQVVLSEGPHRLAEGCWTTGHVPRRSFESAGRSMERFYREGDRLLPDDVDEDQAIVINLEGKGLVIASGCAHAGIVNTVERARAVSGEERVHAIVGGFHLGGASAEQIDRTVAAVQALDPALIAPTHCTGFEAIGRFASAMPRAFARGLVGTRYLFSS